MLKIVGLLAKKIVNDYCEGHNCDFTYEKIEDEEYVLMCEDIYHIDEYGINYDGSCYKLQKEKLYRGNYSLLAMNVDEEQIAKYIP